jgi:hypothetical protein
MAAGAVSGAFGRAAFAVASGAVVNPIALGALVVGGAVAGGAVAYLAPAGGYGGMAVAAGAALLVHTPEGTSVGGFMGVAGDAAAGAVGPPVGEDGAGALSPWTALPIGVGSGAMGGALATEGIMGAAGPLEVHSSAAMQEVWPPWRLSRRTRH